MRVGIYIDAPNFLGMVRSLNKKIDIDKLLAHLTTKKRNIGLKRIFYDYNPDQPREAFEKFIGLLRYKGFEIHQVPLKKYGPHAENGYKSRTDWELSFTMLEDVTENRVDVIILISGDSDFSAALELCKKIKKRIKIEVYCTGNQLSYELKEIADAFFLFENLPELYLEEKKQAIAS